ncbi:basal body-orientation factor 1-like [Poeciliopsis prolifica]|uniref:basal body-orientation factor 1-like n=1 Tax=Poeciliopsis prolifica TaxID=188132 RepID=UPI002413C504|nr:basal body-orientation factor 1-like [Poeciliopsis prolifica]
MPTTKASKSKREKRGKGKKSSKHEPKTEKEPDLETARANAALWELKLKITEQDLSDYRGAHHNMACMNEQLTNQLLRCEQNNVDMTGYWQKEVEAREEKIRMLEDKLRKQEAIALLERSKQAEDFKALQDEMRKMEESEARLEEELSDMRKTMDFTQKEHEETLRKTEDSFQRDQANLKREMRLMCNQEIAKMKLDHHEAIVKMESALTSAFKEQDRLNETLKTTIQEAEGLKKLTHSLAKEKLSVMLQKDMLEATVKKDTAKMEVKEKKLSEVMAKAASLELALAEISRKSEQQEEKEKRDLVTIQASQVELDKLQKLLAMREKELQHVKQLAKTIVDKRREVEEFFHEALDHVRQEIVASRLQNRKEALQDYRQKFREATAGMIKFPPIRSVNRSPNYLYAAAQWSHPPSGEVNMSHLTWEQKEKVLSLLFAKMNGQTERKVCKHQDLCASSQERKETL